MRSRQFVRSTTCYCALGVLAGVMGCSSGDGQTPTNTRNSGTSASIDQAVAVDQAAAAVQAAHPNAKLGVKGNRIRRVYGAPLARGASPDEAAERFRQNSASALGVQPDELTPQAPPGAAAAAPTQASGIGLMYDKRTGKHKFRLYRYTQQRDGIPVFRGGLRSLVREGQNTVVWANSDVRPMGNFRAVAGARVRPVDVQKSLAALRQQPSFAGQQMPAPSGLTNVSSPTLTIFAGVGVNATAPRMAMKYTAEAANGAGEWTFVADLNTGDVLHVESNILFEVNGSVEARVSDGPASMECAPLTIAPFTHHAVTSDGVGTAYTDADGDFSLPYEGTNAIVVESGLDGQYFDVTNYNSTVELLSESVTPPGPVTFLHNEVNTVSVLAQTNAYKQSNEVRDFLLNYVPEYPTISAQIDFPVSVNRTDLYCPGNAWYTSSGSTNFCVGSTEYGNTAFASVVHHEYGHHIVNMGGSGQGAYGEGLADTVAMLIAKDPNLGAGFYLNQCDNPLRTADNDCQYSATSCSTCGYESHYCGQLLSGIIWDIWGELDSTDPENADDIIASLILSSVPMHTGTLIDETIAIDLLTLDDDDELLENGTPHYNEICTGFEAHGLECPPISVGLAVEGATDLDAEGPDGGPFAPGDVSYTLHNLGPEATIDYAVNVPPEATWLNVDSPTGSISLGDEVVVTVSIDQVQAALLSSGKYTADIDFVNVTTGVGDVSRVAALEVGTPVPIYSASFDTGPDGFTPGSEAQNLWHWTTTCADTEPGHTTPGSLHFGLDSNCTFSNGFTVMGTITSPVIEVPDSSVAELSFNYYLQTEGGTYWDQASVAVSVDGGPFEIVASNGSGGQLLEQTSEWEAVELDIAPLLPDSGACDIQIQLGFDSRDGGANDYQGFFVDDIIVRSHPTPCIDDDDCIDGLICNGTEQCIEGTCVAGTPVACDDGVACTIDQCDESTGGCTSEPNDNACSDGLACNGAETCDATLGCQAGEPLVCDDGSTCTDDSCDDAEGCVYEPVDCDDGNACTVDSCDENLGCVTEPLVCEDGNECTTDSCDEATGCVYDNNTDPCTDDGNECTDDVCSVGMCTHPDNGLCPSGPCAAYCDDPITFSSVPNFQSGNLGTGAVCYETTEPIMGGNCGNFVAPRQLFVNGVEMSCSYQNWAPPPAENGGYCVYTTEGDHPWAYFTTWGW